MNIASVRQGLADLGCAVLLVVLSFARRETTDGSTTPWPREKDAAWTRQSSGPFLMRHPSHGDIQPRSHFHLTSSETICER